jgi:hypothetical protein
MLQRYTTVLYYYSESREALPIQIETVTDTAVVLLVGLFCYHSCMAKQYAT